MIVSVRFLTSLMSRIQRFQSTPELNNLSFDIPIPDFDDRINEQTKDSSSCRSPILDQEPFPIVPHQGQVPHITSETMHKLLSNEYDDLFTKVFTIDCRFSYEYSGGHIMNAININDPVVLKTLFFEVIQKNVVLVFHCEFSQCRGPEMASFFRNIDRNMNENHYPQLHYPHIYILEGGFCEFSRHYSEDIEGKYVRMLDGIARSTGALIASNTAFRENFARAKHSLTFEKELNEKNDCQIDPRILSPKIAKRQRMTSA